MRKACHIRDLGITRIYTNITIYLLSQKRQVYNKTIITHFWYCPKTLCNN